MSIQVQLHKQFHSNTLFFVLEQELSKKAVGREESFQNGLSNADQGTDGEEAEHEIDVKRSKKTRATTGDLARFLRTDGDHNKHVDLPSPHGYPHGLHPDHHMMSNTPSMYSLTTDITGVTGIFCFCYTASFLLLYSFTGFYL